MIFCDASISRFLLVMIFPESCDCGQLSHHDYDALTRFHTDRWMSLITYMHEEWSWANSPSWVRATYTTPAQKHKLPTEYLSSFTAPTSCEKDSLPIYHVTNTGFHPSLLPSDLDKIDNVAAQGRNKRASLEGKDDRRAKVLGSKEQRPEVGDRWLEKTGTACAFCKEVKKNPKDLQRCGKCKLVSYCNKECQRMAWPTHRLWCKKA